MVSIVFTTTDTPDEARRLARDLVSEQIAACVNIIPNVTSVYKWEGTLNETAEFLLMIKTTQERIPTLLKRLQELHTYEVPEALVIRIQDGLPDYLSWVEDSCKN